MYGRDMMDCDIDAAALRCRMCGATVTAAHVRRNCSSLSGLRPGLGDMVAAGLAAIGITKDRVEAVVGVPCGCDQRQAMMNKAGTYLGLPPGSTAAGD